MHSSEAPQRPVGGRVMAHVLGNVLLGIAIGLLVYYYATDLLAAAEQRELVAEMPRVPSEPASPGEEPPPPLDFDGWRQQDRAYWSELPEGGVFGRLVAPRMDMDVAVVKGTDRASLRKGPGWIDWSDLPGPSGNVGIAGHRTTYGAPFRQLDRLRPGDEIRFYSPYRVYTYRVRDVFSVRPNQVEVVESTEEPLLTMSACHPPYSARLRLIAQSELVSVRKIER